MQNRPALFRGRHFEDVIIVLCVRWYLRYSLSYRDLQEMMAERGLSVDQVTIWRWVQRYAPVLNQRIRRAAAPESLLEGGRNLREGCRRLGLPLSCRRFYRRDHRIYVVAEARPDRGEAVPTPGSIRRGFSIR